MSIRSIEPIRKHLWRVMYDAGWYQSEHDDTLRSRIAHAVGDWHHWYDWGNPVMWLVGRYDSGSAGTPRGRDLWWIPIDYVEGAEQAWLADFEQRHGCYVTRNYSDVRATSTLDWRIYDLQDDGHTIVIGRWPNRPEDQGHIQKIVGGLTREQMRLLLEWYLIDHKVKAQWLGLRPWAYWKGLHAAVNHKVPFTCQTIPDRNSGGYSHWHCQLKKRHPLPHRFRNYTWGGPGTRVQHDPKDESVPA